MICRILDDFRTEKGVPAKLTDAYRDKIPNPIIQIWKEYGFGSFMNGFLKTINPNDFQDLLQRAYFRGAIAIPVFATALGDLIVWEKDTYLTIVRFRHGTFSIMEKGCRFFLNDLSDDEYVEEYLKPRDYFTALREQGTLEYGECFGYFPLLCSGGPEDASRLKKVKMFEHLELILSIGGPVG